MNQDQENHLGMYLPTNVYCVANATITANLPNFNANLTILQNTITQIQNVAEQQKIDKKGATTGKKNLAMQLIVIAADNARKMGAYAKFTNNPTLEGEVHITESDFKNSSDTDLKDYAQIIYDRAQSNVAALATYGITAATQTAFLAAITAYNNAMATPRVNTTVTSQATKQLVTLFKTAETALANMDAAVEIIRLSQPNYYNGYKTARKIVSTGNGSLVLKGSAIDMQSGEPVKNATFTFQPVTNNLLKAAAIDGNGNSNGNGNGHIVKKTADKGIFYIKSAPDGTYNVTIEKPGYKIQNATVSIVNGELADLVVQLEKA